MTQGAADGLLYCAQVLIPSLFPFMVLSSFVVNSGISAALSRILSPVTVHLFRLPGSAGVTILLSMFCGYPVGARGVRSLLDQRLITQQQAARMLYFTVGAGPAFLVFAVGASLLHNTATGIILLIAQVLSQLILGFFTRFLCKDRPDTLKQAAPKEPPMPLTNALVTSCGDSTLGILQLCGMVVLFSALLGILQNAGGTSFFEKLLTACGASSAVASSVLPILLEVTGGCFAAIKAGAPVALLAFAIGWGGICVHFQIYATLGTLKINRVLFTLFRFAQGILCAVFTHLIFLVYTPAQTQPVFSNVSAVVPTSSTTAAGSIALVLLSFCFLFSYQKQQKNRQNI